MTENDRRSVLFAAGWLALTGTLFQIAVFWIWLVDRQAAQQDFAASPGAS